MPLLILAIIAMLAYAFGGPWLAERELSQAQTAWHACYNTAVSQGLASQFGTLCFKEALRETEALKNVQAWKEWREKYAQKEPYAGPNPYDSLKPLKP